MADYQEYVEILVDEADQRVGKAAFTALAAEGARMDLPALATRAKNRPGSEPKLTTAPLAGTIVRTMKR